VVEILKEVLSQSEIDSLIHALSTGQINADEKEATTTGASIRVYDFRRPNKFSKEQMRTLQVVHENFARILANFLSAYLRTPVQIRLASVSQVTFEEFIFSLPTPTLMTIFNASSELGSAMLETNPQFVFPIIDLLFGGDGETPKKIRELTEIELTVMKRIILKIMENLRYAWEDIVEITPQIENMDTNPQFNQMIASNETVALITLSTQICKSEGLINVCFPYVTLEKVIGNLTAQHWFSTSQPLSKHSKQLVENSLEQIEVEVSAILGSATIHVEDFLQLEVGDVILFEQKVDTPMTLLVEGAPMYDVHPGVFHGHRAVQLLAPKEDSDE
jgi:flagellar motor switch protein FliM